MSPESQYNGTHSTLVSVRWLPRLDPVRIPLYFDDFSPYFVVVLSLSSYYIISRYAWPRLHLLYLVLISLCRSCLSLVDLTRAILS